MTQKTIKCKLNGKQSVTIPVQLKKNGKYITEPVDVSIRGFLKFENAASGGTGSSSEINTESEAYQQSSASLFSLKPVIYPVLFTSNVVTSVDGKLTITILPRSEDVITDYKTIMGRINFNQDNITNDSIVSDDGVKNDEQLESSEIIIITGQTRNPYSISIELTILDYTGTYYGQTIDRGVQEETSQNSIWKHGKNSATSNLIINYYNDEDWIPTVTPILDNNSATSTEVIEEIDTLNDLVPFGASPIYDSMIEGAKILNSLDVYSLRKLIYLFTDNESNMSLSTINEAIDYINNINGVKKTPVIIGNFSTATPVTVASTATATDTRDLNKIATFTGGQSQTVFSDTPSEEQLNDLIRTFYGKTVGSLGYGKYSFVIDLGEVSLIENIETNFTIPNNNTTASWTIEHSTDSYQFNPIKDEYSPNELVDLLDKNIYTRYIKINCIFIMGFGDNNSQSQSPSLDKVIINYNKVKTTYLLLNLEDNDIPPYHMVVSVDANNVDPEQIEVGLAKSNAISWVDFSSDSQPSVKQNGKIIVPIRFSQNTDNFPQETLLKIDQFSLKAKNGQWDSEASIILYDKDDNVIDSSNYQVYPRFGTIILNSKLPIDYVDGDYKIGIINKSEYKVGLKITNKSKLNPVEIYSIGKMYTTGKDLLPPIEKIAPEASDVNISPEAPTMYDTITLSYTFFDKNFDKEDLSNTKIKWYINDIYTPYLDNLRTWNNVENPSDIIWTKSFTFPITGLNTREEIINKAKEKKQSILKLNDKVYCTIQVSDGTLFSRPTKSNAIQVIESSPIAYGLSLQILAPDGITTVNRITTNTILAAKFNFYSDTSENKSTIIWFVNDVEFKRGTYGVVDPVTKIDPSKLYIAEKSTLTLDVGLRMGNRIKFQIIPSSNSINGSVVESNEYIVQNDLPYAYDVAISPRTPTIAYSLILTWKFFDFEVDILKDSIQADASEVKWYRALAGSAEFNEITDTEVLNYITTSITNKNSTVSSAALKNAVGQKWYAEVTPFDGIDYGSVAKSNIVTLLPIS